MASVPRICHWPRPPVSGLIRPHMERAVGVLGLCFLLGLGYLLSNHRARIRWKTVAWGPGTPVGGRALRVAIESRAPSAAGNR
ncbi:MAG: Na+ dependent nucleoside transporter N-terminal domain-containing protein [Acidobacteriota bacterium]